MSEGASGIATKAVLVLALLALGLVLAQRLLLDFMAQGAPDYAGTAPAFDLRTTFEGPLRANGVIYGPTGRVTAQFVADMEGRWDGAGGTLTEDFAYSSGRTQQREWRIVPGAGGRFTATAADVIGTAEGEVSGAAAVMRYRLLLPPEAGGWAVDVTDWLYRGPDGVIVNRSQFRRFGILVGELVGTIRPTGG